MTDAEFIENFHSEMRQQFQAMHTAHRPNLAEIQAQQQVEAIERIKNILFADLLCRMIKNHARAGDAKPLEIDLLALEGTL